MPKIDAILQVMANVGASDLHIGAGASPLLRIHGVLEKTKHKALSGDETRLLLYELLSDDQIEKFERAGELDLAYTVPGLARFRVNIFKKHQGLAGAFRIIPHRIPTLDGLGFPGVLKNMLAQKSGLILVTGPTNSGKTTTLAAMVDHLNEQMAYHIITLEDPLEFIHTDKNCLIHQRQIGEHSQTFAKALRAALREDPNVVLVGEMRDNETITLALTAAEIGLLVLATLHTKSAVQTIGRMVDSFPVEQQSQIRLTLSEVLVGICSQQLIRKADGKGRVAALEILVRNHAVATLIRETKTHQINNAILTGKKEGMQVMEQHLRELIAKNLITAQEAARYVDNPQALLGAGGGNAPLAMNA
jgi:twitching motility protein PilT